MTKIMQKRLVLGVLLLLFLLPTLSAFYAYFAVDRSWWAKSNKGELLSPVIPFGELVKNTPAVAEKGKRKWRVLLVATGNASKDYKQLVELRHRLLLLGKEMSRTREGMLAGLDELKVLEKKVALRHLEAISFYQPAAAIDKKVFAYVVDPIDNVILSYQKPQNNLDSIYSDLKHLLKASNIG